MAAPRFHRLAIADIRRETADAVSLAFAVPERLAAAFAFRPGQYLTLRARIGGEEVRRSYSICSGLDEAELRIAVKRVAGGVFSNFVHDRLRAGDAIDAMTPAGRFVLPEPPGGPRIVAAAACGSGITPVLSILKTVLAREPESRFALFYGNRTGRDIMFAEELAALKDRYITRLSVTHVLSREPQDMPVFHGRLDAGRIGLLARSVPRIDEALLCGPAAMMDAAATAFAGLGLAPEHIHREHFTPGDGTAGGTAAARPRPAAPPPDASVGVPAATIAEIIIDGRRHQIPLTAGVSIIDAARACGLDLPYSCRGGMCCTCRARLVAGKAEMAVNYSLQPWEIAAGFILACQARPLTPRLTLDFDQV